MKLLLDTHVFIWMHGDPDRLSRRARELLVDADAELHLSVAVAVAVAVAWELGIKIARERLTLLTADPWIARYDVEIVRA